MDSGVLNLAIVYVRVLIHQQKVISRHLLEIVRPGLTSPPPGGKFPNRTLEITPNIFNPPPLGGGEGGFKF